MFIKKHPYLILSIIFGFISGILWASSVMVMYEVTMFYLVIIFIPIALSLSIYFLYKNRMETIKCFRNSYLISLALGFMIFDYVFMEYWHIDYFLSGFNGMGNTVRLIIFQMGLICIIMLLYSIWVMKNLWHMLVRYY